MKDGVFLVITTGVKGDSRPEKSLNGALKANTKDLLEITNSVSSITERILITNSDELINFSASEHPEVITERTSSNFHFGEYLFEIINNYDIDNLLYLGGGSGPLFERKDFKKISSFLVRSSGCLIANNFYSTDIIGLSPAEKITDLDPPKEDNDLGWLGRESGLEPYEMTRNAKTQLDFDTPVDLLPVKLSGRAKGNLRDYLSELSWGYTQINDILPKFTNQDSGLVVAGRIGASTWFYLENNTACQLDVISEGRRGSAENGKDRRPSWLGEVLEDRGPENFLESITKEGTGLFLDTRVLFNYKGEWPSGRDRFYSDLLCPEAICCDYLRKLTSAAIEHPEPVVLGGHSMVSGSLYLLSDVAWQLTGPENVNIRPMTFSIGDRD